MKNLMSSRGLARYMAHAAGGVMVSAMAGAATLTGIVSLPGAPNVKALVCNACIVKVLQEPNHHLLDEDVTDHRGRFSFTGIPVGIKVKIQCDKHKSGSVLHGWTFATITRNPTDVNVQLLPRDSASEFAWYDAGRQTARIGTITARRVVGKLLQGKVPAASVYQFVRGAQSANAQAFSSLERNGVLSQNGNKTIVMAISETEKHFRQTNTVPTFSELRAALPGSLTKPEYVQTLGFLTTKAKAIGNESWVPALDHALAPQDKHRVLGTSHQFDRQLFGSQSLFKGPDER